MHTKFIAKREWTYFCRHVSIPLVAMVLPFSSQWTHSWYRIDTVLLFFCPMGCSDGLKSFISSKWPIQAALVICSQPPCSLDVMISVKFDESCGLIFYSKDLMRLLILMKIHARPKHGHAVESFYVMKAAPLCILYPAFRVWDFRMCSVTRLKSPIRLFVGSLVLMSSLTG